MKKTRWIYFVWILTSNIYDRPCLSKSWTLIANFDVIIFLHTNHVLKQSTANKYEYEIKSHYSVSTLNFDEKNWNGLQKNQTNVLETKLYNYWLPRELIQISWHHVQKLSAAFWAVYGLRWKFMQIQTQQVRNFRIFLLYALAHPLYVKHMWPQSIKRKCLIIFFASLGKKHLRMSLLQSCKTNLWKHCFF